MQNKIFKARIFLRAFFLALYYGANYFSLAYTNVNDAKRRNGMFFETETNKDLGAKPSLINIHNETLCNNNFRTIIWTGEYLQATVMSIPVGGEIGLEIHDDLDQFIRIESGCAAVYMGKCKHDVRFYGKANPDYAIIIPSETWHNIINAGNCPLKVYSVYAPPKHPFGTVHKTKLDSDLADD
jgi:mannose-6-phosphate isomerase-like protein (cupin superfamily)